MSKIAIISDIHGNLSALMSVLKELKNKNITDIYNLGDSLYGPLEPIETYRFLKANGIVSLSGNGDRILNEPIDASDSTMNNVRKIISDEISEWLLALPLTIKKENLLFCHGTPMFDDQYLLEKVTFQAVLYKSKEELAVELKNTDEKFIFCGHSHLCNVVELANKVIINVGSVGLPAYEDDLPFQHKMESGSPHARYCVFELCSDGSYGIEFHKVAYDWNRAAQLAESQKRDDWAFALRTGRCKS